MVRLFISLKFRAHFAKKAIDTNVQQLAMCACQLSYGKLYKVFSTKWVFLSALAIFEAGSVVCGATPTSVGLIMGRVVAGFGSAGIFSGVSQTRQSVILHARRSC
jgi:MFS family permease